eukprot:m.260336 g.260336  ORF g.260336 m.260336 type:complete len:454 (+) comp40434_c1_seq4:198-1559(+)
MEYVMSQFTSHNEANRFSGPKTRVRSVAMAKSPSTSTIESSADTESFSCISIESNDYFLSHQTFKRAKFWLDHQMRQSIPDNHRVLMINGMAKTGKTTFVNDVMPHLIRNHNAIFHDAWIWHIDFSSLNAHSQSSFMLSLLEEVSQFLSASNVAFPIFVEDRLKSNPAEHPLSYYYSCVCDCIRALSAKKHAFILMNEFQRWFEWTKNGRLDRSVVPEMRQMFKYLLLDPAAPKAHFVITGSAMGSAWVHVEKCPTNGDMLSNAVALDLPAHVSDEMYQTVVASLQKNCGHSELIVEKIALYCDRNHVLLAFLVDEFLAQCKNGHQFADADIKQFCFNKISKKVILEMWEGDALVLRDMSRDERKIFQKLVSASGATEDEFMRLGGWKEHLEPFCEVLLAKSCPRKWYCMDKTYLLHSVLFQAFVLQFIGDDGNLVDVYKQGNDLERDIALLN